MSTARISRKRSAFYHPCILLVAWRVRDHFRIPDSSPALSHPDVMVPFACPNLTLSTAVRPAKTPLSSHLVEDCSAGLQSTGAAPFWISSHVMSLVCIASVHPVVPCPPLTEPSEDMMAVLFLRAEVNRSAWSAACHTVCPHMRRKLGVGACLVRGIMGVDP